MLATRSSATADLLGSHCSCLPSIPVFSPICSASRSPLSDISGLYSGTKGNCPKEWIRCVVILSAAALPFVVGIMAPKPATTVAHRISPAPSFSCFQSCPASSATAAFPLRTAISLRTAHIDHLGSLASSWSLPGDFSNSAFLLVCGITDLRARISPADRRDEALPREPAAPQGPSI